MDDSPDIIWVSNDSRSPPSAAGPPVPDPRRPSLPMPRFMRNIRHNLAFPPLRSPPPQPPPRSQPLRSPLEPHQRNVPEDDSDELQVVFESPRQPFPTCRRPPPRGPASLSRRNGNDQARNGAPRDRSAVRSPQEIEIVDQPSPPPAPDAVPPPAANVPEIIDLEPCSDPPSHEGRVWSESPPPAIQIQGQQRGEASGSNVRPGTSGRAPSRSPSPTRSKRRSSPPPTSSKKAKMEDEANRYKFDGHVYRQHGREWPYDYAPDYVPDWVKAKIDKEHKQAGGKKSEATNKKTDDKDNNMDSDCTMSKSDSVTTVTDSEEDMNGRKEIAKKIREKPIAGLRSSNTVSNRPEPSPSLSTLTSTSAEKGKSKGKKRFRKRRSVPEPNGSESEESDEPKKKRKPPKRRPALFKEGAKKNHILMNSMPADTIEKKMEVKKLTKEKPQVVYCSSTTTSTTTTSSSSSSSTTTSSSETSSSSTTSESSDDAKPSATTKGSRKRAHKAAKKSTKKATKAKQPETKTKHVTVNATFQRPTFVAEEVERVVWIKPPPSTTLFAIPGVSADLKKLRYERLNATVRVNKSEDDEGASCVIKETVSDAVQYTELNMHTSVVKSAEDGYAEQAVQVTKQECAVQMAVSDFNIQLAGKKEEAAISVFLQSSVSDHTELTLACETQNNVEGAHPPLNTHPEVHPESGPNSTVMETSEIVAATLQERRVECTVPTVAHTASVGPKVMRNTQELSSHDTDKPTKGVKSNVPSSRALHVAIPRAEPQRAVTGEPRSIVRRSSHSSLKVNIGPLEEGELCDSDDNERDEPNSFQCRNVRYEEEDVESENEDEEDEEEESNSESGFESPPVYNAQYDSVPDDPSQNSPRDSSRAKSEKNRSRLSAANAGSLLELYLNHQQNNADDEAEVAELKDEQNDEESRRQRKVQQAYERYLNDPRRLFPNFILSPDFDFDVIDHPAFRYKGDVDRRLCYFDLFGICKDRRCQGIHQVDYFMSSAELVFSFIKEFKAHFGNSDENIYKVIRECLQECGDDAKITIKKLLERIPIKERRQAASAPMQLPTGDAPQPNTDNYPVSTYNMAPCQVLTYDGVMKYPQPVFSQPIPKAKKPRLD